MAAYYILYNPHAGNGTSEATAKALKACGKYEPSEIVAMTDISSYSEFFGDKEPASVILCGGDGTLNRFINESVGVKFDGVYYMASGSGNDFLRDLEISGQTEPIRIDKYIENLPVCEVNGKEIKVLNGVGYGIDGYCCQVGDEMKAKGESKIDYTMIAILGVLFKYKPTGVTITVDGVEHRFENAWITPTMNGRFYGGGMMPTPSQVRNSGELSVMVFHIKNRLRLLTIFPSLFKGEHIKHEKHVSVFTGKDITVKYDVPKPLQVDGETILGVTECRSVAYEPRKATV